MGAGPCSSPYMNSVTSQNCEVSFEVKMAKRNRASKGDRRQSCTGWLRTGGGVIHGYKRQRMIGQKGELRRSHETEEGG